jgi:hypothetical protein
VGIQQMDAEVVETVACVVRLLRRAAELAWKQAEPGRPRSSHQLLGFGDRLSSERALGLLPRRPAGWAATRLGTTQLSFSRRLSSCCAGSVSLLGLRALVAELVWEAITGAGN